MRTGEKANFQIAMTFPAAGAGKAFNREITRKTRNGEQPIQPVWCLSNLAFFASFRD
jgi:hypothetical protein